MKEKILIVDDEKDIVKMLEYNLAKDGFSTISSHDGENAVKLAKREHPDLIVLDLMLPGMDGFDVCKVLKTDNATSHIPIVMLTAKSQETDVVVGLELGADDYVIKPFSVRELIARIKAVLRRKVVKGRPEKPEVFETGGLAVDFSKVLVRVRNKTVELTAKEFELLKILIKANGRVLSRDYLLDNIWGFDNAVRIETRTVDVHIRTLRKKLKSESKHIITVKSFGYRFEMNED